MKVPRIKLLGEGVKLCKSSVYENVRGGIYVHGDESSGDDNSALKFSRRMCRRRTYSESYERGTMN